MTILTVDHPRGHPPFCASVVVEGDRVRRAAPFLVKSCKLAGWSAARLADYWRRSGATVEEVRDDASA